MRKKEAPARPLLVIAAILFAISFSALSFYLLIQAEPVYVLLTLACSFLASLCFLKRTGKESLAYVRSFPIQAFAVLILSLLLLWAMYVQKGLPNIAVQVLPVPFFFYRLRWWLLSWPALFYVLLWVWRRAKPFIRGFQNQLTPTQKQLYLTATVVSSIAILLTYRFYPQWYQQFDIVYSIDSGWCYDGIFPDMSYYDIRHPVLSIITFPIWSFIHLALRPIVPLQLYDTMCAACVQIVNAQCLIVIGLMIGKLSGSEWVSRLYLASFPTLLFTLFFEKYQLCTFLLVLYACQLCKSDQRARTNLILAAGAMPTNIFLFADEVLIREPFSQKTRRLGKTALFGVAFLICAGRIHMLNPFTLLGELSKNTSQYGHQNLPLSQCFNAFTKLIHGSFLTLPSGVPVGYYRWLDITTTVSMLGIFIILIAAIGIISHRRDRFVKTCCVWLASAIVLFFVFQWSVDEIPLFSIYFSWALIPLFQKGLHVVIDRLHLSEKGIYLAVLIPMLAINALGLIDIYLYLRLL